MDYKAKDKRLHKQAIEILHLSRNISKYLLHDLSELQKNGCDSPFIYFTGDIIRQSDSLTPKIIKAENQTFQDDRIKYALSLKALTKRIDKNCERLEHSESNGKDFLKLLRKELKKFTRLQRNWMMSL